MISAACAATLAPAARVFRAVNLSVRVAKLPARLARASRWSERLRRMRSSVNSSELPDSGKEFEKYGEIHFIRLKP